MKKIKSLSSLIIGFIFLLPLPGMTETRNINMADPDITGFNYEYYGAPSVKAGDFFTLAGVSFGGFFESRNEERFTQAPLPNHNWRGFFFISYGFSLLNTEAHQMKLSIGFEHESAHPSQGFWENNTKAYQMVYDNMYRNIHLNSLLLRAAYTFTTAKIISLTSFIDYQFYGFAKNTPELHKDDLGFSNGFSAGVELRYRLPWSLTWYASVFDRIILRGWQRRTDQIYVDSPGGPVQVLKSYPIINRVNTIAFKTGVEYKISAINRSVGIYLKVLYGNIFGLVDSRENRLVISGGVDLHH